MILIVQIVNCVDYKYVIVNEFNNFYLEEKNICIIFMTSSSVGYVLKSLKF